jgi:hypothetical protein
MPLVWLGCRFLAADWTAITVGLAERDLDHVEITRSKGSYGHAAGGTTRQPWLGDRHEWLICADRLGADFRAPRGIYRPVAEQ